MDDNLKWSTHIQLLVKRLSKICFALRIFQQIMHLEIVRSLYYAYFHSALIHGIIFWGGSPKSNQVFKNKKRAIRIILSMRFSCRQLFKKLHILPLPNVYIAETLMYLEKNINCYPTNSQVHTYNIRRKNNLHTIPHSTSL